MFKHHLRQIDNLHENTMGVSANHDGIFHSSNEKVSIGGLKSRVLPLFRFSLHHYGHSGFKNNFDLFKKDKKLYAAGHLNYPVQ